MWARGEGDRLPRGWYLAAREMSLEAEGCLGLRERVCWSTRWEGVAQALQAALGLRSGRASSSPSLPTLPLPSDSGLHGAGSRRIQALVSDPGPWGSPWEKGGSGKARSGDPR